jgi:hypothetical protein
MKKIFVFIASLLFSVTIVYAKNPAPKTWSGYLIDKMCAKRMTQEKAAKHTKTCLTEDNCASSGYGLYMDGKFYPFDANGSAKAAKFIAASSKDHDFQIEVTGQMKKNKIIVTELKNKTS